MAKLSAFDGGSTRAASHAGSWYSDDPTDLQRSLEQWLAMVPPEAATLPARAIIAPHAGYRFSGSLFE
jgi:AmmeMemoRadiSam system protein B